MQAKEKFNYNKSHFNTYKNNLFLFKPYGKVSIF